MLLWFHTHKPSSGGTFKLVWRWGLHDDAHLQPNWKVAHHNTAGFTLPELLIALAVFISVMGGVALLFVNSMRLTRQGFLNQEAYEEAQSALKIVETDLTRAFTSRQYGDYYQFYGTPIGFTFVGLASRDERESPNLSRITYVVYRNDASSLVRTDGEEQITYSLLRYVEPGRDTLDDFPVKWDEVPLNPANEALGTVQGRINQVINSIRSLLCPNGDDPCLENFARQRETMERALKRELWIRMLAGGSVSDEIPNAWALQNYLDANGRPVIDLGPRYQPPSEIGMPSNPIDTEPGEYIVTEHLVNVVTQEAAGLPSDDVLTGDLAVNQLPGITEDDAIISPDDRYFFAYADFVQEFQFDAAGDPVRDRYGAPVYFVESKMRKFWNDWRNILVDTGATELDAIGSPLLPRIPARVTTHFTLFFESPYPNVPDFIETFDQAIDIPSGYHRFRQAPKE